MDGLRFKVARQAGKTEAALIRYVTEPVGTETDSERAMRLLIALLVLYCDPPAIALAAAAPLRPVARHQ
jgi:hypothetical protein